MEPASTASHSIRVAVIGPGDEHHGITRYARVVADGMAQAGCRVTHFVPADRRSPLSVAAVGYRARRGSDVIFLQTGKRYWGSGWRQFWILLALRASLLRCLVVVTAHDSHTARIRSNRRRRPWSARLDADECSTRLILGSASLVLTCSEHEADLLAWSRPRRSAVIPHFVEDRSAVIKRRRDIASEETQLLTVLGYIHGRKAQVQAVRAVSHLDGRTLMLAGGATPSSHRYLAQVLSEAEALGVANRVSVTGYLPEVDLENVLARTRVGIAPYERIAASGSLSTLIASGVPIVARRHPYLAQLSRECPASVFLYDGDDPADIAQAVRHCLDEDRNQQEDELLKWAAHRSVVEIGRRHVERFADLMSSDRLSGSVCH